MYIYIIIYNYIYIYTLYIQPYIYIYKDDCTTTMILVVYIHSYPKNGSHHHSMLCSDPNSDCRYPNNGHISYLDIQHMAVISH